MKRNENVAMDKGNGSGSTTPKGNAENIIDTNGSLIDPYRNFIAISRYARWDDEKNRRETWTETVDRYVDYMKTRTDTHYPKHGINFKEIRNNILNHKVMPSMRALMTSGEALERCNVAGYNCSFIGVDSPRAFDEAMYILMCGTGVGFSVESKYTDQLPVVNEHFEHTDTTIVVHDSKAGWARAFKEILALLWQGQIPNWDMTKVRPAGARLKTFGGRASGPEPLEDLFKFSVETFTKAAGRRLKPIECHDIMCKVGDVVVSGGVRRSAMISLSNLEDYDMARAKSGNWWDTNGQRALANNSAVYERQPSVGEFLQEWNHLYQSKSGERGIFSLQNAQKTANATGRRDGSKVAGTNPCITGDSLLMTDTGWVRFDEAYLRGTPNNIVVDGRVSYKETEDGVEHPQNWVRNKGVSYSPQTMQASEVFLTQENAEIVKIETSSGYSVRLTPDHLVMTKNGMVEAGSLQSGDKIFITRGHLPTSPLDTPETLSEKEAVLMGLIAGDGTFTRSSTKTDIATIVLWGEDTFLADDVVEWVNTIQSANEMNIHPLGNKPFSPAKTEYVNDGDKVYIKSTFLAAHLEKKYGFTADTKHDVPREFITNAVSTEARFYVAALAFRDGTVNKTNKVGSSSVRINQSNRKMLSDIQLVMLANGINSNLYSRRPAEMKTLPDGKDGMKDYPVKENFELVFMANAYEFVTYVGFLNGAKQVRAENIITESRKQNAYATVTSVTPDGKEDVYCLQEDERRILCANGITMRRCGEILLRNKGFCNLSEVVVRQEDTLDDLKEKVRVATVIGTLQSTLTDFKYLRKVWRDNAEEERLLGVSLTGQFGHPVLSGGKGLEELEVWLSEMKQVAVATNEKVAKKLGIPVSAAITTVKPSGCRPWDAVTTTYDGVLTLEEIFQQSGHVDGETWHDADIDTPSGRISKTYDNGIAEVMSVRMHYGHELRSTRNHQWFVEGRGWVRTDELLPGDVVEWVPSLYTNTEEAPFAPLNERAIHMREDVRPVKPYPTHMSPELAWMLGYLWGDGAQSPGRYRIRFTDQNVTNLEKAQRVLLDKFGINASIAEARKGVRASTLDVANKYLWHWLIKNDVWKYFADDVDIIPAVVRRSSQESIIAFFAGLNDADGWVGVGSGGTAKFTISTSSALFAKHLQDVSWAVGLNIYRSKNTKFGVSKYGHKPMHLLGSTSHTDPVAMKLFAQHSTKGAQVEIWHTSDTVRATRTPGKVVEVVSLGEMATYDVEVENTHFYYDGGFKSHNTASQLTGVASGMHPWHSEHYIRSVRGDNKDPLTQFLKDVGIPNEPDVMKPLHTTVFYFPIEAPVGSVTRDGLSALQHLEMWKAYKVFWTEHNPSITVTVRENEWVAVAAWVYDNWEHVGGISFLPHSDHTYKQAPYQEVSAAEFAEWVAKMPNTVDWSQLSVYELEDATTGSQELACTAGACDVVDIGSSAAEPTISSTPTNVLKKLMG